MSIITTYVILGRVLTAAESTAIENELANCIAAGTTNGSRATASTTPLTGPTIRIWTTEAAADEWLTSVNAIVPPPAQAMVITVGS
jgi:hypothetical protein